MEHEKLPTRTETPLASGCRPESDSTPELNPGDQQRCQGLIGVLRWTSELGRLGTLTPVSAMPRCLVQARQGRLQQLCRALACSKERNESKSAFDDSHPEFSNIDFNRCGWSECYPGAKEVIPPSRPDKRGKGAATSCFVDAGCAGCKEARRSQTGAIAFVNRAPIVCCSKRQNIAETSAFGSKTVASKTAIEMTEGRRHKMRMVGVPVEGPRSAFCGNDSVVKNVTRPESPLKKKHNSIACHKARGAIALETTELAKEDGSTSAADLLTKPPVGGPALRQSVEIDVCVEILIVHVCLN